MSKKEEKRVEPIRLSYEDGTEYVLEFSRETISFAEDHGFRKEEVSTKTMTRLPELFFYAFRMHHPGIKKDETDRILFEDLGGLSDDMIIRLSDLFIETYNTLVNQDGKPKNSKLAILM